MTQKEKSSRKIRTDDLDEFGSSPFSSLRTDGLPEANKSNSEKVFSLHKSGRIAKKKVPAPVEKIGSGQRLEIRREKSGRGGKTVTTVCGFPRTTSILQKNQMLSKLKKSIGTGGTWNGEIMELQGDRREDLLDWLTAIGYKPILAGG